MKYFLMLFIIFYSQFSWADVYMIADANGNITYTDEPTKDAKKIQIMVTPEVPAERPVLGEAESAKATVVDGERKPYTAFLIATPKDQDTIQNEPNIVVSLLVAPQLQEGDKIQVFVDEKPVGSSVASTSIDLGRLERGTHRIRAALLDREQKVLKLTQTITVFIHYAHLGVNIP